MDVKISINIHDSIKIDKKNFQRQYTSNYTCTTLVASTKLLCLLHNMYYSEANSMYKNPAN